ncbi:MAG: hypothetical protein WD646_09785 [Actinomycetota bacterium]
MRLLMAAVLLLAAAGACSTETAGEVVPVDIMYDPPPLAAEPSPSPTPSPTPSPSTGSGGRSGGSQAAAGQGSGQSTVPRISAPKVQCPTGSVTATANTMQVHENKIAGSEQSRWDVLVGGNATNGTTRQVGNVQVRVDIRVPNAAVTSGSATVSSAGPGKSVRWTDNLSVVSDENPQFEHVHVSVSGWSWGDPAMDAACPHG